MVSGSACIPLKQNTVPISFANHHFPLDCEFRESRESLDPISAPSTINKNAGTYKLAGCQETSVFTFSSLARCVAPCISALRLCSGDCSGDRISQRYLHSAHARQKRVRPLHDRRDDARRSESSFRHRSIIGIDGDWWEDLARLRPPRAIGEKRRPVSLVVSSIFRISRHSCILLDAARPWRQVPLRSPYHCHNSGR